MSCSKARRSRAVRRRTSHGRPLRTMPLGWCIDSRAIVLKERHLDLRAISAGQRLAHLLNVALQFFLQSRRQCMYRPPQLGGVWNDMSVSPAWNIHTEITAGSTRSLCRAAMVWHWSTIEHASGMGSRPRCGCAACAPFPVTIILNRNPAAMIGPVRKPKCPAGKPGQLCMPNTACVGHYSNSPSSIILRAPAPPSSPG